MTTLRFYERRLSPATGLVILLGLAIGGLFYVKWLPYYHKAFAASLIEGGTRLLTRLRESHLAGDGSRLSMPSPA